MPSRFLRQNFNLTFAYRHMTFDKKKMRTQKMDSNHILIKAKKTRVVLSQLIKVSYYHIIYIRFDERK